MLLATAWFHPATAQDQPTLSFPVQCDLGATCFIQQLVDTDSGPDARDPFCGAASYDGHTGTDIRVPQLLDTAVHGTVVAAANGTVRAIRDGQADRFVDDESDRAAVAGRECGNGVVIDHAGGLQTQYCHLAQGSVAVSVGDTVSVGQTLGAIGLSGLTQFPHLEFLVRRDDEIIDPFSGQLADGDRCGAGESLWSDQRVTDQVTEMTRMIGAGFSSQPVEHDTLIFADPVGLYPGAEAIVGWVWAINTQKGDQFRFSLSGPGGFTFEHASDPLERGQATSSLFAGRREAIVPGTYAGTVELVRGDTAIATRTFEATVE
ncbi:MAG: M23 family metallopeptidase [Pseudomonadota bacterium]